MFPTCLNDDDDDDQEGSLFFSPDRSEIDIVKGGVRSLAVATRPGVKKNFAERKTGFGIASVQAIGVGITRRCADCFADSDCLFELSIVPRVENGQGNAAAVLRSPPRDTVQFFFFSSPVCVYIYTGWVTTYCHLDLHYYYA